MTNQVSEQETSQPHKERWHIEDDQGLKWAFQKMEQKRQEAQGYKKMMQEAFDFYQAKIDDCNKDIENFKQIVRQYADEQLCEDPNWDFTDSPFGRIVMSKPKVDMQPDRAKLIDQYKDTDYVKQKYSLDWDKLKRSLKAVDGHVINSDGELIEGVKAVEKPAQIEIKHKNAKGNWVTKEG
jgi:hypothetical protein